MAPGVVGLMLRPWRNPSILKTTTMSSSAVATAAGRVLWEGRGNPVTLYRTLLRELRVTNDKDFRCSPAVQFVRCQFRKHRVTQREHCKAAEEMRHLADTYATYLSHRRKWEALHMEYHAKGERSVADTAKIVGFKLPHDPK